MRVNIYENKHAKVFNNTMELPKVFNIIKTNKPTMPKSERLGVVYASRSSKGRKHEHIESYTGMAFIDVDDCTHPKEVKNLFKVIDCTIACWYSSSGNVHALIKIPICTTKDEFKRRYTLLASDLRQEIGSWGQLDGITTNPTQLAFISSDAEIYINEAPVSYEGIYLPTPPQIIRKASLYHTSDKATNYCLDKAQQWFNSIDTNGYPQVLKYSYTMGGYCATGKIDKTVAKETIQQLIISNQYLNSKNSSGSISTYLSGAMASFEKGLDMPLEWN